MTARMEQMPSPASAELLPSATRVVPGQGQETTIAAKAFDFWVMP
jgi:hypothetical protein